MPPFSKTWSFCWGRSPAASRTGRGMTTWYLEDTVVSMRGSLPFHRFRIVRETV